MNGKTAMPMPTLGDAGRAAAPERVTMTIRAEELPKAMLAKLIARPVPGSRYVVTAEPAKETDEEKIVALREHIMRGVADADAGRLYDEDEVFAELQARFPEA